ncbi:MAG: hypothetical protein V7K64_16870 [Nostoc sp.]|uniref:hypothetical protein n=1 Tax=unclassified Nostoc TaxID=2593658 RepID=UPI001DE8E99D|nr:hypothetical protein [Nostoc sp. JL34]MBN3886453.1 hypothetical protein [Nostoc sp. JL34]
MNSNINLFTPVQLVINPVTSYFRQIFQGILITNSGYDRATGDSILTSGNADLVSFGKLYLANPDLPKRLELDAHLNAPDPKTFY